MTTRSFAFRPVFAIAMLAAYLLSAPAAFAGGLEVKDAWISLAPPVMKIHAGYFMLKNTGGEERHLVAVEAEAYGSTMLHVSREVSGVATMEHVHRVTIAPGKSVTFAPGGLHVMLMGAKEKQVEGGTVPLTFVFEDGEKLSASATIRKSTASGGDKMDHSGHAAHQHKGM